MKVSREGQATRLSRSKGNYCMQYWVGEKKTGSARTCLLFNCFEGFKGPEPQLSRSVKRPGVQEQHHQQNHQ
jgi:hypothetical protein